MGAPAGEAFLSGRHPLRLDPSRRFVVGGEILRQLGVHLLFLLHDERAEGGRGVAGAVEQVGHDSVRPGVPHAAEAVEERVVEDG